MLHSGDWNPAQLGSGWCSAVFAEVMNSKSNIFCEPQSLEDPENSPNGSKPMTLDTKFPQGALHPCLAPSGGPSVTSVYLRPCPAPSNLGPLPPEEEPHSSQSEKGSFSSSTQSPTERSQIPIALPTWLAAPLHRPRHPPT